MGVEDSAWPGAPSGRDFAGTERYRVVRKLGEGGMGVVYEAVDEARGRSVALKTLSRFDADGIYRIKQEFRALSDFSHPHLVKLHELVFDADHWFFTMELVDGVDLLEWVHGPRPPAALEPSPDSLEPAPRPSLVADLNQPSLDSLGPILRLPIGDEEATEPSGMPEAPAPMPEVQTLPRTPKGRAFRSVAEADLERLGPALGQLVEGIMALHDTGRLHRDIKPSNVLVSELGRVVLLDFGLVTPMYDRLLVKSTVQGMVCGTVAYMSPEQGAGEPLSPASDWYSLGVILFEALTGKLPFTGTMFRVLMDKQSKPAPAPRDLVPDVPERLDRLCRALLEIDPAARPDGPAILRALGQDRQAEAPPSAAFTASLPGLGDFVGRHAELRVLSEAYAAARSGRARVVLVGGHSGVGKTALLRRFLEPVVEDPTVAVLAGRCHERELMPFKGVDGIIDALSRYLRRLPFEDATALLPPDVHLLPRLFPTLGRVEAIAAKKTGGEAAEATVELRKRAFDALRALLDRLARRTTLVLSLDDLQWGDADSGELLCHLLAPPEPPPVLVLGSYRDEGTGDSPLLSVIAALEEAPRGLSVTRLALAPLGQEEASRLAAALLVEQGAPWTPDERARRAGLIALESGGDPLFVYELAWRAAEGQDFDAEVTATEATPVRRMRLEQVLRERFDGLTGPARRLLEVVAVAAGPVALSVANEAAGLDPGDDATFAVLKAQRLLRSGSGEGGTVEVYHDRIRETLTRPLEPAHLRAHHASLARVLRRAADPDPEALVLHLEQAGESVEASRFARAAAQHAFGAMAFERAAALYGTALRLADPNDARRWQIVAWQAECLASAGRGVEAAQAYLQAARACGGAQGFELERRAAEQYLTSGHEDEGLALLKELLQQVGLHWPKSPAQAMRAVVLLRAKLALSRTNFEPKPSRSVPRKVKQQIDVCWSLATGLAMVDVVRAAYFGARMLGLALAAGDPQRAVKAFALEVALVGGMDRTEGRTERLLQFLDGIAASVDRPHSRGLARMARGFSRYLRGQWRLAEADMTEALEIFTTQCTGVAWETNTSRLIRTEAISNQGRLDEVGQAMRRSLAQAAAVDNRYVASVYRTFPYVSVVWLAIDEPERARAELDAARVGRGDEYRLEDYSALVTETNVLLYEGRGAEAFARVARDWARLDASLLLRLQMLAAEAWFLRARAALAAAAAGGDVEAMQRVATESGKAIAELSIPQAAGMVALIRAQKARLRGRDDRARALLTEGRTAFAAADMGLHAAVCLRRLGELTGGRSGRDQVEAADRFCVEQGVVRPAQLVAVFAPVGGV